MTDVEPPGGQRPGARSRFRRRSAPGATPTSVPRTVDGERVLAHAAAGQGSVLATRRRLVVLDGAGEMADAWSWEELERASWDRDRGELLVEPRVPFGTSTPQRSFALDDPGRLVPMIRERVTASVVVQRPVAVQGRAVRVVGRRAPVAEPGPISWYVDYDAGVDPTDPAVVAIVEEALIQIRAEVSD